MAKRKEAVVEQPVEQKRRGRPPKAVVEQEQAPARKPARAVADKDAFVELSALAAKAKALEDAERAKTGGQNSFITIAQGKTGVLIPGSARHIEGAGMLDYVIPNKKLVLRNPRTKKAKSLDATILGVFKLYCEKGKSESAGEIAPTVGFWMPEDAEQVPAAPTEREPFARGLPSGNILVPIHWVFVYLHDYPDVEDAVISLQSLGNRVHTTLMKTLKARCELCTELRFNVGQQPITGKNQKEPSFYPLFEVSGRNYEFKDGQILPVDGGLGLDELKVVLERSHKIQEDYAMLRLVAKKNLPALLGTGPARAALPAGKASYADDEEDEEDARF